jgi:hypothetical protein
MIYDTGFKSGTSNGENIKALEIRKALFIDEDL